MMISQRLRNKHKLLKTLQDAHLTIQDIQYYTALDRLTIVPLLHDFLRWNEVVCTGAELNPRTKRKRKQYRLSEKGERKLTFLETKYGFTWKPVSFWNSK